MKILKALLFVIVLVSCFSESKAERPIVKTKLSADTIWIGDQILLQVEMEKDQAQQIGFPEFKDGKMTEKIEILDGPFVDTIDQDGRKVKLQINYKITSFDAGNYALEGFPFVIVNADGSQDTIETKEVNYLYVKTFDIDTTKQEIFDIKDPIDTPLVFAEIKELVLWGGIGALLLAIIIYFIVKWYRNRRVAILSKPKEPAHIVAIKSLEALQHKKLWQSGKIKEYYSELSDILRIYLENRYDLGAMEMTSDEILDAIKDLNSNKIVEDLKDFLRTSDLVKFAKWLPDGDENVSALQIVFNYVEQTKLMVISETE